MHRNRRTSAAIEPLESRIAPAFAATIDLGLLSGADGFTTFVGAEANGGGGSISGAGDVNGDGFDDFIVGALNYAANGTGAAYVVFGRGTGFPASLPATGLDGTNGFRLVGEGTDNYAGASVSAAGDVNGDGFDDIIIGAYGQNFRTGAAYVVFGKESGFTASMNLSTINGTNGFKLVGEAQQNRVGISVSGAGDVNHDGFDDVIIGATFASGGTGAAYVVFGKMSGFSASTNVSTLNGTTGFKIAGQTSGDEAGGSVAAAGDVNGDGFDDVIVGAEKAASGAGAAYVVFGKANGFAASINVNSLNGTNGFALTGEAAGNKAGRSVGGGADFNKDGFDDIIIGAPGASPSGASSGAAYVVFGKAGGFSASANLSTLTGSNGFKLTGTAASDYAGAGVGSAGDVNGDGFGDFVIGAPYADTFKGAAYVVLGRSGTPAATLALSSLDGLTGFKLITNAGSGTGKLAGAAGDVNGDGADDIFIGSSSSSSFIVFGVPAFPGKISKSGRVATFVQPDGDRVTVKVTRGSLDASNFVFSHDVNLVWQKLDFATSGTEFRKTDVTVTVKKGPNGDGRVNLGAIAATGIDLGVVKLPGDLGQIDAGDADLTTKAVRSLTIASNALVLGTQPGGVSGPFTSNIAGSLGKLTVKGTLRGYFNVAGGSIGNISIAGDIDGSPAALLLGGILSSGNIGNITVKGSVIGGGFGGIYAGGKIGAITIGSALTGSSALPATIVALGTPGATSAGKAIAIKSITVGTNVENANIVAGYNTSLAPTNGDASIGPVLVKGNWTASSMAAGVQDSTANGFGRNDVLIGGGSPSIIAKIASITINGTATGSASAGNHYGITAERIGKLVLAGAKQPLTTGADDLLLDATNNDFHLVDFV